ncbi:MAG: SDR family oxidoreductase [Acidobacteriota bacterium]|nr:SDR family oxidoreductase [Acidobacteriota bacterium]
MRVLITGGAGFLGSHLCDALLAEGHAVLAVDNLLTGSLRNLEHLSREPNFDFLQADVCGPLDPGAVDYIFNAASPASPVDFIAYPLETLRTGAIGTLNLLELARRSRARFMMFSTSESYGDPLEHPQKESYWGHVNPVGMRASYDEAKRFAEAATMAYHRSHNLDTRIARIFNTYGPRMRIKDGRVISNFLTQAILGEDITVYGEGSQTRSFCYVSDEIEAILRLSRASYHEPVNLGNPNEFTVMECARLVLAVSGSKSRIVFKPLPSDDPRQRLPDISLAKQLLGWEPTIDLPAGLKLCLGFFEQALRSEKALQSAQG